MYKLIAAFWFVFGALASADRQTCETIEINNSKMYGKCCVFIKDESVDLRSELHDLIMNRKRQPLHPPKNVDEDLLQEDHKFKQDVSFVPSHMMKLPRPLELPPGQRNHPPIENKQQKYQSLDNPQWQTSVDNRKPPPDQVPKRNIGAEERFEGNKNRGQNIKPPLERNQLISSGSTERYNRPIDHQQKNNVTPPPNIREPTHNHHKNRHEETTIKGPSSTTETRDIEETTMVGLVFPTEKISSTTARTETGTSKNGSVKILIDNRNAVDVPSNQCPSGQGMDHRGDCVDIF